MSMLWKRMFKENNWRCTYKVPVAGGGVRAAARGTADGRRRRFCCSTT